MQLSRHIFLITADKTNSFQKNSRKKYFKESLIQVNDELTLAKTHCFRERE